MTSQSPSRAVGFIHITKLSRRLQTGFLLGEGKWEIIPGMYIVYPAGELVQSYPLPKMSDVGVGSLVATVFLHSCTDAAPVLCGTMSRNSQAEAGF